MKLTCYTETVIDSCHQLHGYDGNCSRLHGHSWKICVWAEGYDTQLNKDGILFDFNNVKRIKETFDHKYINDIAPFNKVNPTAENLVKYILEDLSAIYNHLKFKIRVYETAVGKETYCEGSNI